MRIAIDVRTTQAHSRTGLWAYTQGVVEGLSCVDFEDSFFLLGAGMRVRPGDLPLNVGGNFQKVILPVPDRSFLGSRFLWNEVMLPGFCSVKGVDVFFQPAGHRIPSWGRFRKFITIHDLRSLHIDDFLPQDIDGLKRAVKLADGVICISEFTKNDVVEHLGADEKKVFVVYNGVDRINRAQDEAEIVAFRERLGLDRPFFFSLGMVPRKNVRRSIEAFAKSGLSDDFYLVFAGAHGGFLDEYKALAQGLGLGKAVVFVDYIDENDLRFLYSSAIVFVFPSLFEGFGLPVLEAQMCGCPVMCSNVSALPEVVGDSALLVNPYSVDEIASAMRRLAEDENLRRQLSERGLNNAQRFSWQTCAKNLLNIFSNSKEK